MSLSEILRSKNFSKNRLYYYTDINFDIANTNVIMTLKLDTGSPYTIIGLSNFKKYKSAYNYIKSKCVEVRKIYDASGTAIDISKLIVTNLQLTDDIVFEKISIYVSDIMKDKSVLGMDIISLFMHAYRLDTHSTSGTYWIHNYEDSFKRFSNLKDENGYYNPSGILSLTDKDDMSLDELRSYCMFLEHELEIQKNINSGLYIVNNKLKELENKDS